MGCEKGVATTVHPAARPAFGSRLRILEDNAIFRRKSKQRGAGQIGRRMRLAVRDTFRRDDARGTGMPPDSETHAGQRFGGAGDHGPAIRREAMRAVENAGQNGDASVSVNLIVFDDCRSRDAVEVGPQLGDGLDAAAAVSDLHAWIGIDAAQMGPVGPAAFDGADGRDQDAVHVEENAFAAKLNGEEATDEAMTSFYRWKRQFYGWAESVRDGCWRR